MDDHILKILEANKNAKRKMVEQDMNRVNDEKHFEALKKTIDVTLNEIFERESSAIYEESEKEYDRLLPIYNSEYDERVKDLNNRFAQACLKWEPKLMERIVKFDGK